MRRLWLFVTGATAIMLFAALVLVYIPRAQMGTLKAPAQLEPYSTSAAIGRGIYIANGCIYCHSQQVRDASYTYDEERGWGRPSVPEDYVYDYPHLVGTMRTGPDLINVAVRLPDRQWHLLHLYQPRAVVPWSIMPSYPFLFEIKDRAFPGEEVVDVPAPWAPPDGKLVVAKPEASRLVDYLLSLDRTYPVPNPPSGHGGR